MRDRPHPNHKLEWPGGVVPEWAKPQQNLKRRGGKGAKGGPRGERQGGSSPSKRERLQKVMAQSGHGSRRNIEILIAQGHITINGQVAKLGDSCGPGDKVKLDGNLINLRYGDPTPRVLLYHKPAGEIVSRDDPEKRPTVFDKLPKVNGGRWVSVGRLDFNTEGLLMFTTSGELANRLTHPRFEVEREYAVRIVGEMTDEQRAKLLTGVDIDGESCKFDALEERGGEGTNRWYHVILREGKNREVRRMMEAVGLMVSRLTRVRFGSIELPGFLKRGMMKEMEEEPVQELLAFSGMNEPPPKEEGEEDEEDEFDNIGNRVTDANRHPREAEPEDEGLGNRFDPKHDQVDRAPDDIGNRIDHRAQREREREGNGNVPGPVPGQGHGQGPQRRPQGGGGNKPFFGKKGRGPRGQGQGQGQPQPHQQHGQGQGGQGQPQGHNKHKRRNKHGGQGGNVPHGDGRGNVAPRGEARVPREGNFAPREGNVAHEGNAPPREGNAPQPGNGPQQPRQGQGQGPGQGQGQGKPGRHRRHKNRNRNRGGRGGGEGEAATASAPSSPTPETP